MKVRSRDLEDAGSWFFWLTSAVVAPLVVGPVLYIAARLIPEGTSFPGATAIGVVGLYTYLVAPVLGVVLLAFGVAFASAAWKLNQARATRLAALRMYFVVMTAFGIYIAWWHLSGQELVAP